MSLLFSAPLRGSNQASGWIGRIGACLIRTPVALLEAGNELREVVTYRPGELNLKRIANSVETHAANSRFVKAINTIPITPGIPYHTIMGDRGKGDAANSSHGCRAVLEFAY